MWHKHTTRPSKECRINRTNEMEDKCQEEEKQRGDFLIIVVKRASEIQKKPAKDESYFW